MIERELVHYTNMSRVCSQTNRWEIWREIDGTYSIYDGRVEIDRAVSFQLAYSLLQVYRKAAEC